MGEASAPVLPVAAPSNAERVRSEQIDQLRSRVDAVLANLVAKNAGLPVALPKQQQQQLSRDDLKPHQHWIVDPYGDQGKYEGDLLEEDNETADSDDSDKKPTKLPHGTGRMEYTDGRVYEGEWQRGAWHGLGKAIFSNRDQYEGQYHLDQRHGAGIYKWSDGRVYQGEFCKDQRHGFGVYTWPDGASYTGNFGKGLRHGEGTYTFRDGSVYSGQWKRGKYDGFGECTWADGRCYKGAWVAGKAHGQGIEIRPDGSIRHDGLWENDKPVRNAQQEEHQQQKETTKTAPTTRALLEGTVKSATASVGMDLDDDE